MKAKKSTLTEQGLSASLFDAMEFGFKAHERGDNLQKARSDIAPHVKAMIDSCGNLPREILRIEFRKAKNTKVSVALRDPQPA